MLKSSKPIILTHMGILSHPGSLYVYTTISILAHFRCLVKIYCYITVTKKILPQIWVRVNQRICFLPNVPLFPLSARVGTPRGHNSREGGRDTGVGRSSSIQPNSSMQNKDPQEPPKVAPPTFGRGNRQEAAENVYIGLLRPHKYLLTFILFFARLTNISLFLLLFVL